MVNSKKGPDSSWEMISRKSIYWEKYGMAKGDYLYEKNILVELYKEEKITLREMLCRWKRDVKPHKEVIDNVLIPLLNRCLMDNVYY